MRMRSGLGWGGRYTNSGNLASAVEARLIVSGAVQQGERTFVLESRFETSVSSCGGHYLTCSGGTERNPAIVVLD